jgi:malate dehydrogenase (oxaloacetate-decarboxylating)(NADP+)
MTHDIYQDSLAYHRTGKPGKIEVCPTKELHTQRDLSLAYSPGVAQPVLEIAKDPAMAYEYTAKGNLVAVISNGTAILGLGNRGALASKPVMEGKAVLFKVFAGIDAIDLELATEDPQRLIDAISLLEPTLGGINLEDIKAPECFIVERELQKRMSIPVFHDDQHGTAVVSSAGLLNALILSNRRIETATVVINGAGAAGIAIADMLLALGLSKENLTLCDTRGVIHEGRQEGMNEYKAPFARKTDARTLEDVLKGADVFIGVSKAGALTESMLLSMAMNPIVFALANPDPEMPYSTAKSLRSDVMMATGRSDNPNQVNNLLCFPFLFRGALDTRASAINQAMKVAAVHALASLARETVPESVLKSYDLTELSFGSEYLLPKPFDPRLLTTISPAVAKASMESGVARLKIDIAAYTATLPLRLSPQF